MRKLEQVREADDVRDEGRGKTSMLGEHLPIKRSVRVLSPRRHCQCCRSGPAAACLGRSHDQPHQRWTLRTKGQNQTSRQTLFHLPASRNMPSQARLRCRRDLSPRIVRGGAADLPIQASTLENRDWMRATEGVLRRLEAGLIAATVLNPANGM
jgi:hypothetical protein